MSSRLAHLTHFHRAVNEARQTRSEDATHTGYHSDIKQKTRGVAGRLTRLHSRRSVGHSYDLTQMTKIGQGGFSTVYAVARKGHPPGSKGGGAKKDSKKLFALKILSLHATLESLEGLEGFEDVSLETLTKELDVQARLDHPNICRVVESFVDYPRETVHVVMELLSGGTLLSRLKRRGKYDEGDCALAAHKMLSAIKHCHQHGVVHRDIKLDNLVYEHDGPHAELKLIDFGLAFDVRANLGRAHCPELINGRIGTFTYMAPELLIGTMDGAKDRAYDSSVDIWAIGICVYMLLAGVHPFSTPTTPAVEVTRRIVHEPLAFPQEQWGGVSGDARDFCRSLLAKEPAERLNASSALQHPWLARRATVKEAADETLRALAEQSRGGGGGGRGEDGGDGGQGTRTSIVASLEAFAVADDLRKLALATLSHTLPPSKVEGLRKLFIAIDADHSGTISRAEFHNAMLQTHPELEASNVDRMFDSMDIGCTGEVNYLEFLAGAGAMSPLDVGGGRHDGRVVGGASAAGIADSDAEHMHCHGDLLVAFAMLDRDNDGYISREDIVDALAHHNVWIDEHEAGIMISRLDSSDRISLDGFKSAMLADLSTRGTVGLSELAVRHKSGRLLRTDSRPLEGDSVQEEEEKLAA